MDEGRSEVQVVTSVKDTQEIASEAQVLSRNFNVFLEFRSKGKMLGRDDMARRFFNRARDLDQTIPFEKDIRTPGLVKHKSYDLRLLTTEAAQITDSLNNIRLQSLDFLPFSNLNEEEEKAFIRALKFKYSLKNFTVTQGEADGECFHGGYYYFTSKKTLTERNDSLGGKIMRAEILNSEETQEFFNGERNTYKVHLMVPIEFKKQVLKLILEHAEVDPAFKEALKQWKMKANNFEHYKEMPTFVFYPQPSPDGSERENCEYILEEIDRLLIPLAIPRQPLPRFSMAYGVNNLSYVQGNGDFKAYLQRTGRLAEFYDPNQNFALRRDTEEIKSS